LLFDTPLPPFFHTFELSWLHLFSSAEEVSIWRLRGFPEVLENANRMRTKKLKKSNLLTEVVP
jgi:hypothetical protein